MKEAHDTGVLSWLRPDTKTQVTVEHRLDGGAVVPLRVNTVIITAQHGLEITLNELRSEIKEKIVKRVIPPRLLDDDTVYHASSPYAIGHVPSFTLTF